MVLAADHFRSDVIHMVPHFLPLPSEYAVWKKQVNRGYSFL